VTDPDGLRSLERSAPHLAGEALAARYAAPELPAGSVCRTNLLNRLDKAFGTPLVLVTAPAGYGKTTLLAQWTARREHPVAWVRLEETTGSAGLADSILTAVAWMEIDPVGSWGSFALVVDDAHMVEPGVLREAVLDVLTWLPAGSQVVVASRCAPDLPVARMRSRQSILELSLEDLSMSAVEAASLIHTVGIDLTFTAVQDLVRRTEGWPVALRLAASFLGASADPEESLAHFAGDEYYMSEYLRAELLGSLSPATVHFLTHSSVLERLSGPLCDAVLQRGDSASVLARLAQANVPVQPADPSHEWYRVHRLFREMLHTELRRAQPELHRALHRRGGEWHCRAGDIDSAIAHARAAGDLARAGQLLWANLPGYLDGGRAVTVRRWLSGLTREQAAGCPPLALAAAHSQLARGDIAQAEQWARTAAVSLSENVAPGSETQHAGVLIVGAWAARSGARGMGEDAARAYDLLADDSAWRAGCCLLRGTSALLTADRAAAERQLEEGAARGMSLAPESAALCLAQLAVLALDQDDPEPAADLARRARDVISHRSLGGRPTLALTSAVSAAADVRQGRLDEARSAADTCMRLIGLSEEFAPWYVAETRILLARGLLALGDAAAAREQLAEASRLARRTSDAAIFERWFDQAWDQFDKRAETELAGTAVLTMAELRVLRFLPTHFSFHEIAERLHVSSNTVKTHAHAIYRKLDASSRSEAVATATGAGLLGHQHWPTGPYPTTCRARA
jgi:LuxR family maltose regulon positive regulatory protein